MSKKLSNLFSKVKRFWALLTFHELVKMPKQIKKEFAIFSVTLIGTTFLIDLIGPSIKFANYFIANGNNSYAFIFFCVYIFTKTFEYIKKTFIENKWQTLNMHIDDYINGTVIKMSNIVRGKVYSKKANGNMVVMENPEIIFQMHKYIQHIWNFWKELPIIIYSIFISFVLFAITLILEPNTSSTSYAFVIFILFVICTIFYCHYTYKKVATANKYRPKRQECEKIGEKYIDALRNIEPISDEEFEYRAKLYLDNLSDKNTNNKEMYSDYNVIDTKKAFIFGIFMLIILIIETSLSGGTENFSNDVMVEVLAISAIYTSLLEKVDLILKNIENIFNTYHELEGYSIDVFNIFETYDSIANVKFNTTDVDKVTVNPMIAEYPKKESAYRLSVDFAFTLKKGCCYLFFGPTGCGKSTLIHYICGKLLQNPSPISYGMNNVRGYLASLLHETNGRLGTEFVLNEIIFNSNPETADKEKLLEIIKGLNLYANILNNLGLSGENEENDIKVISYMASTSINDYSAGQKQRLAIAKLLYNLEPKHQIIAFDEATNALDSETTIKVLKFIKEYCMRDKLRILIFASHQISEMMTIIDEAYTFDQSNAPTSTLVKVEHS